MSSNKQEALLITGAAGYIGSHLLKRALHKGYRVHVLDALEPQGGEVARLFADPSVRFFQGSITEGDLIRKSMEGVDYVIHLAGVSDGRAGKENPELTHKVNTAAMDQILAGAKSAGVRRFLFASTMGVYGNGYKTLLHEGLPLSPVDPYSASKAAGEAVVAAANTDGFTTTSLRIAMVYGIGPKVREDFLANALCIKAVREGRLTMLGGDQQRPQIHIDDLAGLFLSLIDMDAGLIGGDVFNAVSANPSLAEIVYLIQQILPGTEVQKLPGRPDEDSFAMDGSLLSERTGLRPKIGLKEGLQEIIHHYQKALVG